MKRMLLPGIATLLALGYGLDARGDGASPALEAHATPATASALQRLEANTGARWALRPGPEGVGVRHLAGRAAGLLDARTPADRATIAFVAAHGDLFRLTDAARDLAPVSVKRTAAAGLTHARLRQTFHGLAVWGKELVAHFDAEGALVSLSADLAPDLEARTADLEPLLTSAEAIARAAADAGRAKSRASRPARTELVLVAEDGAPARAAWHVALSYLDDGAPALPVRLIDARTGAVLGAYDDLQAASVAATAQGTSGPRDVRVQQQGGRWVLLDDTRASGGIATRSAAYATSTSPNMALVSGITKDSGYDPAGVDAHFGAAVVFDFYKATFGRESWDGQGAALDSYVHVGDPRATTQQGRRQFNNAYWDGEAMNYGDGDGSLLTKLSAGLDVCAHEITHGVTSAESNLRYQGESGALNESISDMFAVLVEHGIDPDLARNARIGEAVVGPTFGKDALRYMDRPSDGDPKQPATYKGANWYTGGQDNGGVHINSGVPNNAFWIMTTGAKNPDTNVGPASSIGWQRSAELWYAVNTSYLRTTSTLADAAQATIDAARQLGFSQADQNIVECAWIAVRVKTGTCKVTSGGSGGATSGGSPDGGAPPPRDAGGAPDGSGARDAGAVDAAATEPTPGDPPAAEADDAGAWDGAIVMPAAAAMNDPDAAAGCGCAIPGTAPTRAPLTAVAFLAATVALRRRRPRRAERDSTSG